MERLKPENKRRALVFKGTDYLGITKNQEYRAYLIEGLSKYGSSFGGSRLSGSFADLYHAAENRLAEISGSEAALTFSSGTLSGLAIIEILDKNKQFIYAPDTHPALSVPENNYQNLSFAYWKNILLEKYAKTDKPIVILSNSLNPLNVEKYEFSWVKELAVNKKIILIIDDSHGFGILGKEGGGVFSQLPDNDNIEKIVISSLGKAWGLPGGVVLASKKIIYKLRTSSLFGGASPIIPAYLSAFLKSTQIYTHNRKRLKNNIHFFIKHLSDKNQFKFFADFPVFSTQNHALYDLLLSHNIEISAFNYPSPDAERYTRIVLSALHSEKDIIELYKAIQ